MKPALPNSCLLNVVLVVPLNPPLWSGPFWLSPGLISRQGSRCVLRETGIFPPTSRASSEQGFSWVSHLLRLRGCLELILKLLFLQEAQWFVLSPGSCEKLLFDAMLLVSVCHCCSATGRAGMVSARWAESVSHLSRISFLSWVISVQKPQPGRATGGMLRLRQQFPTPHFVLPLVTAITRRARLGAACRRAGPAQHLGGSGWEHGDLLGLCTVGAGVPG